MTEFFTKSNEGSLQSPLVRSMSTGPTQARTLVTSLMEKERIKQVSLMCNMSYINGLTQY